MAYLLIKEGEGEGRKVELPATGDIVLGRLASSTVELNHPSVSSRHGVLTNHDGRFWLQDLGSTNGTRVNGRSVAEAVIRRGDVIALGDLEMVLLGDDVAEAPRSIVVPEHITAKTVSSDTAARALGTKAATGPQIAPLAPDAASSASLPKAFRKKASHNRVWIAVIVVGGALAVFLAVLFFKQLRG